ncbi:anti-sigma factor RsiW [Roseiarcus fermentans]|uniref:Anti-sigma factor RsiW n=1 Tax=Roseiarcus fermentans TaxID=1473586 RepID=A0A366FU55_9HYPH|nr:hypothetical protein [Roseiarcus fermentans]RBP17229.1 anti-sigma factor RsiW [Roseiarcus fermentans]
MSDPADLRRLRLQAALDGELDAANALAFERDLAADPALAAEYRELAAVRDAVRRHVPREAAPKGLVDAVLALAAGEPAKPARAAPPPASRARGWLALAASFAGLGFAAGVGLTSLNAPDPSRAVAGSLVSDFARASVAGQPFDVASSDRHTVKPWLAGRTTVSADIVDLAAQGFPLAGGRVAIVDRAPVPTLVYRHNEHMAAVTELPLDAAGARAEGTATIDGYHVARWSDADLAFVAVSDMDAPTLAGFVAAFRAARLSHREESGKR